MLKAPKETPDQFSDLSMISHADVDDSVDVCRDPITALVSCAFIQIFVCKEVLNSCCLNVASQGGSLIKLESLHVASLTRNLF
jgi:hypothetical protein